MTDRKRLERMQAAVAKRLTASELKGGDEEPTAASAPELFAFLRRDLFYLEGMAHGLDNARFSNRVDSMRKNLNDLQDLLLPEDE